MDWMADEWFKNHHEHDLTEEFKTWWVSYYGVPSDYDASDSEQHEYWVRCAFALTGWNARTGA
jgi:hypothetical protein